MFLTKRLFLLSFLVAFFISAEKVNCYDKNLSDFEIPENLYFHVYRNGTKIGYHSVEFSKSNNNLLNANVDIDFNVKFLGINLYKYKHQNNEKWMYLNNNENTTELRLISIRTKTNINNNITDCNEKSDLYEKYIFPTSYWNSSFLRKDLSSLEVYNTQDCSFFNLMVKKLADEKIYDRNLTASRYKLFGETNQGNILDIDIWYNKIGKWVKMIFLKDGSEIEYILDEYHEK